MLKNFFSLILLASAALLGTVAGASLGAPGSMVHELIAHSDGTVGDFSYHSSFIPDTDAVANASAMALADKFSKALSNHDPAGMIAALEQLLGISTVDMLNSTTSGNRSDVVDGPVERLVPHFHGNDKWQNLTFCGFPMPIPDWNPTKWVTRPGTYDCLRLLEMYVHRIGYWDLYGFGTSANPQAWSQLAGYDSCEMDIRRLDLDNQWGARVGSLDVMKWVTAAMMVSIGKEWEDPVAFLYMASISGAVGCQELGPNPKALIEFSLVRNGHSPAPTGTQATWKPTITPVAAPLSSLLWRTTPSTFPNPNNMPRTLTTIVTRHTTEVPAPPQGVSAIPQAPPLGGPAS